MATKYSFKTVMVTDTARETFSAIRDDMKDRVGHRVTDKELFEAVFATADLDRVERILKQEREKVLVARTKAKAAKLAAELAALEAE
jgi:hypothetical protein